MENFSSFSPEEEQEFVVYEERMKNAERSAGRIAVLASLGVLLVALMVIFSDWGKAEPIIKPEAQTPAVTAAPAPTPAPAPAATATPTPAAAPAAPAPAATPK